MISVQMLGSLDFLGTLYVTELTLITQILQDDI